MTSSFSFLTRYVQFAMNCMRARSQASGAGIWFTWLLVGLVSASAPIRAIAARPLGIDVSGYQGSYQSPPTHITWASVPSSIIFAWAKATEGTGTTDPDFSFNASGAKANGILLGAYHYAHPEANTPASEAAHFWAVAGSQIKADGLTLMPMLDIEGSALPNGHVGAASLSDWINIWITDVIQDAANNGVSIKPAIYVSACNACDFDTSVSQWFNDIADYNSQDPQTSTPWTACSSCARWGAGVWNFWQYTSTGGYAGINGNVDHDVFNGTGAALTNTMVATATTNSTILYWDPQGTTGSNPYSNSMTGTWETAKWSYGSAGLATPVNWVDGKAACFGVHTGIGTPAYTVTMNSSHVVAGFFDGALTPNSCDVTIQGSGTINLASGAQALDAHNASDGSLAKLRINVTIAGDGVLYPEGNGQSYLHGTNTFTGGMTLGFSTVTFNGTVNFNNGSAFGTGPITLWNAGNGGALVLEGSGAVTVTNPVSVTAATTNNIVGNPAGLTFSGNWALGANLLTLGGGATAGNQTIISGTVSGTAGLTVTNLGTIVLSGVNTYTGTTTINSPAVFTIGDPGQLGSGTYAGNIVDNGTFNYNSTALQTLSGTISGTGTLKQANAGTLTLTHANTFTGGTTVSSGGTLRLAADTGLGGSAAGLTLNGGCLKNNNAVLSVASTRTITLGASGGYLDAGTAVANTLTVSSKLSGSGPLLINLDGAPVVLANTANNYTGNTIIGTNGPGYNAAGTQAKLKLGAAGVIPSGATFGNVIINQAYLGVLDLAGFSQTINGLSGDGVVTNSTGNGSLTVGSNNVTSTFAGVIRNVIGTLALTKIGSGAFTLNGASAYTGNTAVSAGTLALGTNGSISSTPLISIAAGATLDVSAIIGFTLSGSTALSAAGAATPATVNGADVVNLGSQPITLAYDGVHPALSISQGVLTLNGNSFTINGATLPLGTYTIIQQASGNVAASGLFPVTGTAIGAGTSGSISVSGGSVNLTVKTTAAFSNLATSQSINYGASAITLSGTVSGAGPTFPADGESVAITINGNTQNAVIAGGAGAFTLSYNSSTIPASVTPYAISYSYAGNAVLSSASSAATTLTVNKAPLTVTANGQSKVYGQTIATGAGSTAFSSSVLQNSETIGTVTLAVSSGGDQANAPISGSPYTISASAATGGTFNANNYAITYVDGSLTMTPASLTVTATGTLVYGNDPSNAVYAVNYDTLQGTDTVAVISGSANFGTDATATNYVGTNYIAHVVDLGTLSSPNYTFVAGPDGVMTITNRPLLVTNVLASDKTYDATTAAAVDFSGAGMDNLVNGDDASISLVTTGGSGVFADKNVGAGKTVTISGLVVTGDLATNYTLVQPTATAAISQATLTVSATATNKVYDGTTTAAVGLSDNRISGDDVSESFTAANFADANVGVAKTVTVSGVGISGGDASNYLLASSTAAASANITATTSGAAIVSSLNPSTQTSNVTFTATISSGVGTPVGNVVFLANGTPFSTNALAAGVASAGNAGLPVGTNLIAVQYAAQGNYLGSSASISQVVNSGVILSQTNRIVSIVNNGDGTFLLSMIGTPQAVYYLESAADLTSAVWVPLNASTNTASPTGAWSFVVSNAPPAYYRSTAVNPAP